MTVSRVMRVQSTCELGGTNPPVKFVKQALCLRCIVVQVRLNIVCLIQN